MARKQLTQVQVGKIHAERQEKARELQASIAAQVERLTKSGQWEAMLDFASRFHAYSFSNLLLIQS